MLNGVAPDPLAECARYERAIVDAGGIDLQLLGIGTNGHIGFNEPARELAGATHRVVLKASTRRSNAALFGGNEDTDVPREALSMGMATILRARRIVMIATGKSKAGCVDRAVNGPIATRMPASFYSFTARWNSCWRSRGGWQCQFSRQCQSSVQFPVGATCQRQTTNCNWHLN